MTDIPIPSERAPRSVAGSVVLLSAATAGAQLIAVLSSPILTRIYGPSEFGAFGVFAGVMNTVAVVASLRYEVAVPLPPKSRGALQVVGISLISVAVVTVVVALAGLGVGQWLLDYAGATSVKVYYWLLPIGVLTAGLYQVAMMWAIRRGAYSAISVTRLVQGFASVGSQIGTGLLHVGTVGLILGQLIGQSAGLIRLARILLQDYARARVRITTVGVTWARKRYADFPKYDALAALLNAASAQVPILLFGALFGINFTGYYLLAFRLLVAPVMLASRSISPVLLPLVVRARANGSLDDVVRRSIQTLTSVGFTPFCVIACLAPRAFGPVFGARWEAAGVVAAWTAAWVAFQFVYSPISVVLLGVEAQRTNLMLQCTLLGLRVAAIYIGSAITTPSGMIAMFSFASAVFYIVALVQVGRHSDLGASRVLHIIARELLNALICVVPVLVFYNVRLRALLLIVAVSLSPWAWRMFRELRRGGILTATPLDERG